MEYKSIRVKGVKFIPNSLEGTLIGKTVFVKVKPKDRRKREKLQKYYFFKYLFKKKFGGISLLASRLFGFGEIYTEMVNEAYRVSNLSETAYIRETKWLQKKK